jgi:serine/threonine protein kinase
MIRKESMNKSRVRAFFKEAEILEAMDHKNIVKFYSFHETDQFLLIKMELIRGGTLKRLIEKRQAQRQPFREDEIALFLSNLLEGIRYLHNLNIIHRDLKTGKYRCYESENILFADDSDLSSVKIVDFGLSAKLEIHAYKNVKAQCGTLLYMAPEIFNKPSYTKSVDIWSCAIITYMMFNEGSHPFYVPGMKTEEFKVKLKTNSFLPLSHALAQNFI